MAYGQRPQLRSDKQTWCTDIFNESSKSAVNSRILKGVLELAQGQILQFAQLRYVELHVLNTHPFPQASTFAEPRVRVSLRFPNLSFPRRTKGEKLCLPSFGWVSSWSDWVKFETIADIYLRFWSIHYFSHSSSSSSLIQLCTVFSIAGEN